MQKAVHSMIRVLDETRSTRFYKEAFGLDVAGRFDFNDFTLVYLRNADADFELELTVNKGRTDPYELGTGYGHLAFVVDNLEVEHGRFESEGLKPRPMNELKHDGGSLAKFFFVEDPDGYRIEVIQKHGRYK